MYFLKEIQERTSFIRNLSIIKRKSHFLKYFLFYFVVIESFSNSYWMFFKELLLSLNTDIRSHLDLVGFILFFFSNYFLPL